MKIFLIISIILVTHGTVNAAGDIIFPNADDNQKILKIGDTCEDTGYIGTIERFDKCELAIVYFKEANIYPKIYYFDKFQPIICCTGSSKYMENNMKKPGESNIQYQNVLDGSLFSIDEKSSADSLSVTSTKENGPEYFELDDSPCTTDQKHGILSQFRNCKSAISKLKTSSIHPEIFSFKGLEPVICCVE